jgi:outer membrane protein OmpA-like peptidoglycan-associated protein
VNRLCFILLLVTTSLAAQTPQQEEIRKSIYFGGGSYYIDSLQIVELNLWLDSIHTLEKYEIHLISHTDPIGGKEYNEWLSQMRSEAVKYLLIERLIPEHKISTKDWGLENPLYRNSSRGGMRMNRRVDVILYPIVF